MILDLELKMVRVRVISKEQEDDARILAERKARREKFLAEAKPKGPHFLVSWFRGIRTIRTI